mmetsp:Transcript_15042/g.35591  ORF Transcript_15042/g.35591 Transcript_15042/m.35591 type:complete len:505 (+) Transcript_15042:298-1812(+)
MLAEHAEGIGADTGHRGAQPQHVAQAVHHGLQHLIAEVVAEGVVDVGEVVDVDQRERDTGGILQVLVEQLDEPVTVGQAQQRVVVGLVEQLAVQHDVLEADRDIGAKGPQQLLVEIAELAADIDQRRHRAPLTHAEVQAGAVVVEVPVLAQATLQAVAHIDDLDLGQRPVDQAAVLAGRGDDAHLIAGIAAHLGADQTLGQDAQQGAELGDDALGKARQTAHARQRGAALDDHLQATAVGLQRTDLAVGAHRSRQHRVEPGAGQLGLGLVVVDVIGLHRLDLGRIAGLAGAQHDAHGVQAQAFADVANQLQAGILALHDDVEQHNGEVILAGEQLARLSRRRRVQEHEGLALDGQALHGQLGGLVDVTIVIDDQHAPGAVLRAMLRVGVLGLVEQFKQVVVGGRVLHGGEGSGHGRQPRWRQPRRSSAASVVHPRAACHAKGGQNSRPPPQRLPGLPERGTGAGAAPVARGGRPVCWVNSLPRRGAADGAGVRAPVEFLRRALS